MELSRDRFFSISLISVSFFSLRSVLPDDPDAVAKNVPPLALLPSEVAIVTAMLFPACSEML